MNGNTINLFASSSFLRLYVSQCTDISVLSHKSLCHLQQSWACSFHKWTLQPFPSSNTPTLIVHTDISEEHLMSFILDTSASCKMTQVLNMIPDLQDEYIQESDAKF